jgi:hypothetical protein
MAKLGFIIPRTLSNALSIARSDDDEPEPFHISGIAQDSDAEARLRRRTGGLRSADTLPQRVVRIGRSIIPSGHGSGSTSRATSRANSQAPTPTPLSTVPTTAREDEETTRRKVANDEALSSQLEIQRTIRFANQQHPVTSRD